LEGTAEPATVSEGAARMAEMLHELTSTGTGDMAPADQQIVAMLREVQNFLARRARDASIAENPLPPVISAPQAPEAPSAPSATSARSAAEAVVNRLAQLEGPRNAAFRALQRALDANASLEEINRLGEASENAQTAYQNAIANASQVADALARDIIDRAGGYL